MKHKRLTTGILSWDEQDILKRVTEVIKSGNLSSGKQITEFENKVARLHGKKYGIFVNSGQSALEVSLILAKQKLGKDKLRVLMPVNTYAADLWAILNTGNIPIFHDIDLFNFCLPYPKMDVDCDVILPVDLCGYAAFGEKPSKGFVIEDACQALGNRRCNYGDIICFSFYVSHHITTGCGGMLCLDDEKLVEYARSYIAHGREYGGDFTKYNNLWVDRFSFDKVGASYRGDCLHAALGLSQLKDLSSNIKQRKVNAHLLRHFLLKENWNGQVPTDAYIDRSVFQFFPLRFGHTIDRTSALKRLYSKFNIDSRVLFPLTTQPIFKNLYGDIGNAFPSSIVVNKSGFIVGCHQDMTEDDIKYMANALIEVADE